MAVLSLKKKRGPLRVRNVGLLLALPLGLAVLSLMAVSYRLRFSITEAEPKQFIRKAATPSQPVDRDQKVDAVLPEVKQALETVHIASAEDQNGAKKNPAVIPQVNKVLALDVMDTAKLNEEQEDEEDDKVAAPKEETQTDEFLHPVEPHSVEDEEQQTDEFLHPIETEADQSDAKPAARELKFSDLRIGHFVSKGAVNFVFDVTLPDWVYEQFGYSKDQPMLAKFSISSNSDGHTEVTALRRMNQDAKKARELKIIPLVYANVNFTNPFHCDREDPKCRLKDLERSGLPGHPRKRMIDKERLTVLVMPKLEKRFIEDVAESLADWRRFYRSLCQQLAHAHSVGVYNWDMSFGRNVYVDRDGDAVLFDWNGAEGPGDTTYVSDAFMGIVPPEGWFRSINGAPVMNTDRKARGYDVWQIGIGFAHTLFEPCAWIQSKCIPDEKARLRETIKSLGGNTTFVVNDEVVVDLAEFAGLPKGFGETDEDFRPALCDGMHSRGICPSNTRFEFYDSLSSQQKKDALDFLRSMLRVNVEERAEFADLLHHPFLQE